MITFVYGEDTYGTREKIKEIISTWNIEDKKTLLYHFDGEEEGVSEKLAEFLKQDGLFSSSRYAVIKDLFLNPELSRAFRDPLRSAISNTSLFLIIVSEKKPSREYSFLLKEPIVSYVCDLPKREDIELWIKKEAQRRNFSPNASMVRYFMEMHGTDTWALATELDCWAVKEKQSTMHSNIVIPQWDFFGLLNALRSDDYKKRICAFEILLSAGEDSAKIFNMLATRKDKKDVYANYDVLIKGGKLEYEEVLLDFVLSA